MRLEEMSWEDLNEWEERAMNTIKATYYKEREWFPIKTAPKDGTRILIYGGSQSTEMVRWDNEHEYTPAPSEEEAQKIAVAWWDDKSRTNPSWRFCTYDGGYYGEWLNPTHWMPLPQPPERE